VSALVIDTSSWVSYFAGRGGSLIDAALQEATVHLPPIVAAELLSGKMSASKRDQLQDLLADLPLFPTPLQHWFKVGRLRGQLLAKGLSISTPDAHIAQCAIEIGAELLTEDKIFTVISRHVALRLADQ